MADQAENRMQVRLLTGEKAGSVLEVEESVAQAWLAAGRAQTVDLPFTAVTSVEDEGSLAETNTSGPVEYHAMPSVCADGSVIGVEEEVTEDDEVAETPEKPAARGRRKAAAKKPETR